MNLMCPSHIPPVSPPFPRKILIKIYWTRHVSCPISILPCPPHVCTGTRGTRRPLGASMLHSSQVTASRKTRTIAIPAQSSKWHKIHFSTMLYCAVFHFMSCLRQPHFFYPFSYPPRIAFHKSTNQTKITYFSISDTNNFQSPSIRSINNQIQLNL